MESMKEWRRDARNDVFLKPNNKGFTKEMCGDKFGKG